MALTQVDQGLLGTYAQYTGFKNRIINGAMNVWQRGTSFSTQVYTADRWVATNGTSLTITQSTDVPVGFKYSLSITGTGFPSIVQRIESLNCTDLAGQSITISFWAKQTSGASAESLGIILYYPTAGADNYGGGSTQIASAVFTGTTGWVYYSYTVPAASMVSATANGLQIQFYGNTTGAATYLITGVQLEKGSTATSFDYRPYGAELALCQRYYQYIGGFKSGGICNGTANVLFACDLPVSLRTTSPSYTLLLTSWAAAPTNYYALDGAGNWIGNSGASINGFNCATTTNIEFQIAGFSGLTSGRLIYLNYGNNLISLSAEL